MTPATFLVRGGLGSASGASLSTKRMTEATR